MQAAHPGTLAEVHDKVLADYRRDKAVDLAKSRRRGARTAVKAGEDLDKTAKSLGLDAKASELVARIATVPDVGPVAQLPRLHAREWPDRRPGFLGANWVVYKVLDHQQPNPADLTQARRKDDIEQQLLDAKREMAFEAFRTALDARMKKAGEVRINADNLKLIWPTQTSSRNV